MEGMTWDFLLYLEMFRNFLDVNNDWAGSFYGLGNLPPDF